MFGWLIVLTVMWAVLQQYSIKIWITIYKTIDRWGKYLPLG
jgi:hypothetical protein